MSELALNFRQYLELEKLGIGAFAPLSGFMNEDQFQSVVETMRLDNGLPFPMPIVLDMKREDALRLKGLARVALIYKGEEVGEFRPESFFACDKIYSARRIYGADDINHPGVRFFMEEGEFFAGGPVTLKKRITSEITEYELTPSETRHLFKERGWGSIIGFQTRNVPHRAHEYLQRLALELADGLFIQPLVGRKKKGDYTPQAIMTGYKALIDGFYPRKRVALGVLSTSMRYAGPREAVFHAIIRRNYGCTHFIIGRDHAGVGEYYGKYAAHELARRFDGELGIETTLLHGPFYCAVCDGIVSERTCPHEDVTNISGSAIRAMLEGGSKPDRRLMREEVINALHGVKLFISEGEE